MNHHLHLTNHETMSLLYHFRCSYLSARLGHVSCDLAINEPYRNIHGLEVIRLQGLGLRVRKVLRQQRSEETFAHVSQRCPRRDVLDSVILGEGKWKSWVS